MCYFLYLETLFVCLETRSPNVPFRLGTCCVVQAGFSLTILLHQPLECWDCRHHIQWAFPENRIVWYTFASYKNQSDEKTVSGALAKCFHCLVSQSDNSSVFTFSLLWKEIREMTSYLRCLCFTHHFIILTSY